MSVQLRAERVIKKLRQTRCGCVFPRCLSRVCDVSPGLSWSSHEAQRSAADMRAGSALLSAASSSRRSRRSSTSPLRGFKSSAAAEAGPHVSVLRQRYMNLCYRLLARLVLCLPPPAGRRSCSTSSTTSCSCRPSWTRPDRQRENRSTRTGHRAARAPVPTHTPAR